MHLRLQAFDGPLDLLLHLIKSQEINIFNIPIVRITEQFLSFLRQVPELDFYQAGEYLVTASQLLEIKAKFLVPVLQGRLNDSAASLDDMADGDPRKPLVEKLLEYDAIKSVTETLWSRYQAGLDEMPSGEPKRRADEWDDEEIPIKGSPFDLLLAFNRALISFSQQKALPKVTVRAQRITIQQKIVWINGFLERASEATLREFFEVCDSRYELIVTLMAVLELCKANHLEVTQEENFATITIKRGSKFGEDLPELKGEEENKPSAPTRDAQY